MNKADVILLSELQRDSSRSVAVLAELAGLSLSACHRRIRVLEAQGLIEGYGARLSPQKLGLGLHVFVEISLVSQSEESMRAFESAVERADEVLECHLMSGSSDIFCGLLPPIQVTLTGFTARVCPDCRVCLPCGPVFRYGASKSGGVFRFIKRRIDRPSDVCAYSWVMRLGLLVRRRFSATAPKAPYPLSAGCLYLMGRPLSRHDTVASGTGRKCVDLCWRGHAVELR